MGISRDVQCALAGPYTQTLVEAGRMPEALTTIDLQGRMGPTDYIDFLRADDLPAPICKYTDRFRRPGLAFKFVVVETGREYVWCPFQRYTNNQDCWSYGWGVGSCVLETVLNMCHDEEANHVNRMEGCDDCPFSSMRMRVGTLGRILDGTHPTVRLGH